MADIKTITLPTGTTYNIVDQGARDLISALNSFTWKISSTAADTPQGVTWTKQDGTEILGTLGASASSKSQIYLVYRSDSATDSYDEYITIETGVTTADTTERLLIHQEWTVGRKDGTDTDDYRFYLDVYESEANATNNTSKVTCKLYGYGYANYAFHNFSEPTVTFKINGTSIGSTTGVAIYPAKTKCLLATKSSVITHDADGSKTISVNAAFTCSNTTTYLPANFSKTYTAALMNIKTGYRWERFGSSAADIGGLGALAYSNSVAGTVDVPASYTSTFSGSQLTSTGTFTPAGTVSQPTFSGSQLTSTGTFTPAGTVSQPTFTGSAMTSTGTFTPGGSNAKSAVTISPTTTDVYSMTSAGSVSGGSAASCTLPVLTTSVSNGNLTIGWSAGSFTANTPTSVTLPGRSSAIKAWTGYNTGVANTYAAAQTFTGTANQSISVSGTPSGTVSQPTFTGTANQSISVKGTPAGTVSQPTFTGTANQSISVKGTPAGTVTTSTNTTETKTVISS